MPLPLLLGLGAAIGGISGLLGANKQAQAARDAANIEGRAYNKAQDRTTDRINQQTGRLDPYAQAGTESLSQLQGMMGDDAPTVGGMTSADAYNQYSQPTTVQGMSPGDAYSQYTQPLNVDITQDPGYQFRMQQGLDAVEKSAAARGGFFSGETGKALQNYSQGLASQEYGNAYDRAAQERQFGLGAYGQAFNQEMLGKQFGLGAYNTAYDQQAQFRQNKLNALSSMSNAGQQAATQQGQWGGQGTRDINQYALGAAGAQAQGLTGQANAWAGGIQNLGNQLMSGIGTGMQYGMMNQQNPQDRQSMSPNWNQRNNMINNLSY